MLRGPREEQADAILGLFLVNAHSGTPPDLQLISAYVWYGVSRDPSHRTKNDTDCCSVKAHVKASWCTAYHESLAECHGAQVLLYLGFLLERFGTDIIPVRRGMRYG